VNISKKLKIPKTKIKAVPNLMIKFGFIIAPSEFLIAISPPDWKMRLLK
jgi:hypothetical protein